MMRLIIFFTFLLSVFSFSSCDIINPEEDIPAYIEINPFQYDGTDGNNTEDISESWIYVNGEFLGAFDMPKTIPVLSEGETSIFIDAGIKENGIGATPTIYPFYERYFTTINLTPGEITPVNPTTQYDDEVTNIIFFEDFNGGSNKFGTAVENSTIDVREGSKSGYFSLDKEDNPFIDFSSIPIEQFPEQGITGYIELDYKSEAALFIGMIGYNALGDITFQDITFGLVPRDEWNKVYFNFSDAFNFMKQNNTIAYQIIFNAQIPFIDGEYTLENADIHLDNVKLVVY